MSRGPSKGVGWRYDYDEVARIARGAFAVGQSMAYVVSEHYGITQKCARVLIGRVRRAGFELPSQLGFNDGANGSWKKAPCGTEGALRRHKAHKESCAVCEAAHRDRLQSERGRNEVRPRGATEIVLQCECGWTTDNATAMVWHCRTIHGRRATVAERTPKVSL